MDCNRCNKQITGKYYIAENKEYCISCYEKIRLKCSICSSNIVEKYYISGQYSICEKCHKVHNKCSVCNTYISHLTDDGYTYNDGRKVCSLCTKESVESINGNFYYKKIISFLKREGFIIVTNQVPTISLVGQNILGNVVGNIEYRYVTNNKIKKYKYFNIKVLWGLPEVIFESILVHELMHMYCRIHSIEHLRKEQEEGICNMLEYLYLDKHIPKNNHEELLISKKQKNMLDNDDSIYGDGFRSIKKTYDTKGINAIFDILK